MQRDRFGVVCIDADLAACDAVTRVLTRAGMMVGIAASGADGLAAVADGRVDLVLVDQDLPDMSAGEILQALGSLGSRAPVVVTGAALSVESAVDLMKLGAADVWQKPVDGERLVERAQQLAGSRRVPPTGHARVGPAPLGGHPKSAAERWALEVLKASEADGDLKTIEDWATFAGVSYSSLCEMCRLIGIRPHDARDLTRVLGALIRASRYGCDVEVLLNVRDRRTLRHLLRRAGLETGSAAGSISIGHFLGAQRFVRSDNEGLRVLTRLLSVRPATP